MYSYSTDIVTARDRYFNNYSNQHPLTPLHFIVDLGTNSFMKSIIISVQIQYPDFSTVGFQRRTFTDHLYTIEALTTEQFIHYLYSCKLQNDDDIKTNIKKLMYELDKDWMKDRTKGKKTKDTDNSKNDDENTENEQKNIEKDKEMEVDDEQNIVSDSQNIDNEYELKQINCIGERDDLSLFNAPNKQACNEGKLILTKQFEAELKKLQTVDQEYDVERLIPVEQKENDDKLEDELEFKFEYQKFDNFDHNNWIQWKFIDVNGKVVRRFSSRKTADKVRNCTVTSMAKNSVQTEVWQYDNAEMLKLEQKTLTEIAAGAKKKIIYTSEEDEATSMRRRLVLNKFKPLKQTTTMPIDIDEDETADEDEDEDDDKNRNKNRGRPRMAIVKIIFDNTFAHLVTSDGGLFIELTKNYILKH